MKLIFIINLAILLPTLAGAHDNVISGLLSSPGKWRNNKIAKFLPHGGPNGASAVEVSNKTKKNSKCSVMLPVEKIRGKKITVSSLIKIKDVTTPSKLYLGVRMVMVIVSDNGKVRYAEHPRKPVGTHDWREFKYQVNVPEDVKRAHLTIGLDDVSGTVWYSGLSVIISSANGGNLADAGNTVDQSSTDRMFRGRLPIGWRHDFVGWTQSKAESTIVKKGKNAPFLRINVQKTMPVAMFSYPLPALKPEKTYQLSITCRNHLANDLKIGVRRLGKPYTMFWTANIPSEAQWQRRDFFFRVKPKGRTGIFLILERTGTIDIASIELKECLPGKIKKPVFSVNRKNYLRNSRLPLGLQSGWQIGRGTTDYNVWVSDEKGPSGEKALKVRDIAICSEPFMTTEDKNQQVSFACKGSGKAKVYVGNENGGFICREFKVGPEWQRIRIPFEIRGDKNVYKFVIIAKGELLIDAFRASLAEERGYASGGENEIALTLPESTLSASRIQFSDEPFEYKYYVSGASDGIEIRASITDLYGKKYPIAAQTGRVGKFVFRPDSRKSLGQFRLEAAVFRNGKRISPYNELVVTRLKRPVYWDRLAPDSPFGGHANPNPLVVRALKAGGMNWVRLHDAGYKLTLWSSLEKHPGKWTFDDKSMNVFRSNHMEILGQLGGCPAWAACKNEGDFSTKQLKRYPLNSYRYPTKMDDFKNYVRKMVTHYRGVIHSYIVWNEPWLNGFLPLKRKNSAKAYVALEKAAYETVKATYSDVEIIGCNTGHGKIGAKWTREVINAGGYNYCDAIDYHQYTPFLAGFPGDPCAIAYKEAWGPILDKYGKISKPVYFTEGQSLCLDQKNNKKYWFTGMYKHSVPGRESEDFFDMSDRNVRFVVSILSLNVKKVFIYSSHTYEGLLRAQPFLSLIQADGYPHPQLAAYSALAWNIEDKKFSKMIALGNGSYAYLFGGKDMSTAVIIPGYMPEDVKIFCEAHNSRAFDLYGNPLTLPYKPGKYVSYISADVPVKELAEALQVK